jgi:hypothetical protein
MENEKKDSLLQDQPPADSPFVCACELEDIPRQTPPEFLAADSELGNAGAVALTPLGTPPPIRLKSMAPRPASLAGHTVYFVDVRFMNGDVLLKEIQKVFEGQFPGIRTEFRRKTGGYLEDDPKLWAEIKENHGVMVMAIGH